jgi:hypothetical protein
MDTTYLILAMTMILMAGVILKILKNHQSQIPKDWIPVVALLILMPCVMLLVSDGYIENDIFGLVLSAAMGYFFGTSQNE